MYIRHIRIERFRNLLDIEFGSFTIPSAFADLICIAGPNGAGKSSALEILTFGLTNRYSWQYYNSRTIEEHSFSIQIGLTGEEISRVLLASHESRREDCKTF
jgi:DNA repair exonuclease SbcCD ATPase subunit